MAYEDLKNLSRIRFEKAEECLSAARDLIGTQNYRGAANRSYYAIFHAMRAVLAYDGIDMQHHSGIISEFRTRYLKTEILDRELSKTISALFDIRTNCDYDDFFIVSRDEITAQTAHAEAFLESIRTYLKTK